MDHSTRTRLLAAVAVPALLATGLAQAGPSAAELPTIATHGLVVPPIDGDPADGRTRWQVTLGTAVEDPPSGDGGASAGALDGSTPAGAVGGSDEGDADARLAAELDEISRATGRDVAELESELRPEGAREGTGWSFDVLRLRTGSTAPASDGDGAGTADPRSQRLRYADPRVHAVHPVHGDVVELVGAAELTLDDVLTLPGVLAAEPVSLQWPTATDQYHHLQWGLTNTGQTIQDRTGRAGVDVGHAEAAAVATGRGVVVAVVDSGVQADHPDLVGRLWANGDETCGNGRDDDDNGFVDDCAGWDFANHDATPYDPGADNRHGTHVAGTIAATTGNDLGVASLAPGATIMPLKVFDGGSAPSTRIATAIHYAVDNGADVINLSLGGNSPSSAQHDAIRRARDAGILVVAAAGNDGRDTDAVPTYPAAYDLANIVSVGSHANDGSISSFSNRGATSVDLFAPGENIAATVPGSSYAYMSGTSMAAPMVTAAAALVAESLGSTDALVLKQRLLDGVVVEPAFAGRSVTGGRLSSPPTLGPPVPPLGDLVASAAGLAGLDPGPLDATLQLSLPNAAAHASGLQVHVGRWHDGAPNAVVGHPLDATLAGRTVGSATDDRGLLADVALAAADLAALESGTLPLRLATELPEGRFALALVATDADGAPLSTALLPFTVGDPMQPAPVPAPETTTPPSVGDTPPPSDDGDTPPPSDDGDTPPPSDDGDTAPPPPGGGGSQPGDGTTLPPGGGSTSPPGTWVPWPDTGGGSAPPSEPAPTSPAPGGSTPTPGTPTPGASTPAPGASEPPGVPPPTGGGTTPGDAPPPPIGGTPAPAPQPEPGTEPVPGGPVHPAGGPVAGGTSVAVRAEVVPGGAYLVRFGPHLHVAFAYDGWQLRLVTSPVTGPVTVDVAVQSFDGTTVATHPQSFSYLAASPPPGTSTSPPGSPPPDGSSSPPPSTTPPPGDASPDPGGGTTPPPDGSAPPAPVGTLLDDGMRVRPALGGPLTLLRAYHWTDHGCAADPCVSLTL